jgi:hypothetical protein
MADRSQMQRRNKMRNKATTVEQWSNRCTVQPKIGQEDGAVNETMSFFIAKWNLAAQNASLIAICHTTSLPALLHRRHYRPSIVGFVPDIHGPFAIAAWGLLKAVKFFDRGS